MYRMQNKELLFGALIAVALIPIAVFWATRLVMRVLPGAHNGLTRFIERRRFELAALEALFWLSFIPAFGWPGDQGEWLGVALWLVLAAEAMVRAVRAFRMNRGSVRPS
jgi:hypothetical protein